VPEETLHASLPKLRKLTGNFKIAGEIRIRPADLYVSTGYRQAGIVLVGDAFATSCPVTGTGTDKVFTDVERLCNVHIPDWLATEGMDEAKIAAFYDDPVKMECDAWSDAKAYSFRSVTIDNGLYWRAQRWARFVAGLGEGTLRRLRNRLKPGSAAPPHRAAGPSHGRLA
jgi:2-polyprenyl-6-methoxyphenol hydroxylase-like FAD-dependent oxidoreductase